MPGTCAATSPAAFSTGRSPEYEEVPLSPEWALTTTMSAPSARITGTQRAAASTRPCTSTLPETFALSQMTTPGFVRPSTPTRIGGRPLHLHGRDRVRAEPRHLRAGVHGIGGEHGRVHLRDPVVEEFEAVVELVVAEGDGVVAERVHLRGHRVDRAGLGDGLDGRVVEPERRALDGVAGVEQQGALATAIGADLVDDARDASKADGVARAVAVGRVLVVVPVDDVRVQVGRAHDRDGHRLVAGGRVGGTRPAGRGQHAGCRHADQRRCVG